MDKLPSVVRFFMQAQRRFERTGRVGALVPLFAEEAELMDDRTRSPVYGLAGVYKFWRDYSFAFQKVQTEFDTVIGCPETEAGPFALVWRSKAVSDAGAEIRLEGVTLLTLRQGRIASLRYYSNRLAHQASLQASERWAA